MQFLNLACVELGFTLTKEVREEIALAGPYEPADLARIILVKEGLDPEVDLKLFREVRNAYIRFLDGVDR
jgi:hypothetical protein